MCNCVHDASRHRGGMCWSLINNGWCPCPREAPADALSAIGAQATAESTEERTNDG